MRLFAAIVPPRAVLEEVLEVVRSRCARCSRSRCSGGACAPGSALTAQTTEQVTDDELTVPDLAQMYVPLTGFGNVTLGDSVQLSKALRTEALTWERPTVRLAGGTALEFRGDESVWAKITGDLDALQDDRPQCAAGGAAARLLRRPAAVPALALGRHDHRQPPPRRTSSPSWTPWRASRGSPGPSSRSP